MQSARSHYHYDCAVEAGQGKCPSLYDRSACEYIRIRLLATIRKTSRIWSTGKHKLLVARLVEKAARADDSDKGSDSDERGLVEEWTHDLVKDLGGVHKIPSTIVRLLKAQIAKHYTERMQDKINDLLEQAKYKLNDRVRLEAVVMESLALFHSTGYRPTHDPSLHATPKSKFAQIDAQMTRGVDKTQMNFGWKEDAPWELPGADGNLTPEQIDSELYGLLDRSRIGMYSSETGELMNSKVAWGYIAMESLIKFSEVQAKACHIGKMDIITRQPVKSSLVDGSSKIGEMEAEGSSRGACAPLEPPLSLYIYLNCCI